MTRLPGKLLLCKQFFVIQAWKPYRNTGKIQANGRAKESLVMLSRDKIRICVGIDRWLKVYIDLGLTAREPAS